jgi:hypothetical protein
LGKRQRRDWGRSAKLISKYWRWFGTFPIVLVTNLLCERRLNIRQRLHVESLRSQG